MSFAHSIRIFMFGEPLTAHISTSFCILQSTLFSFGNDAECIDCKKKKKKEEGKLKDFFF